MLGIGSIVHYLSGFGEIMPGIGSIVSTLEIVGPPQHVPHVGNILILIQQQFQHLSRQLTKVKRLRQGQCRYWHQNHFVLKGIFCYWLILLISVLSLQFAFKYKKSSNLTRTRDRCTFLQQNYCCWFFLHHLSLKLYEVLSLIWLISTALALTSPVIKDSPHIHQLLSRVCLPASW